MRVCARMWMWMMVVCVVVESAAWAFAPVQALPGKPNVLFVMIDDLRDTVVCVCECVCVNE
jgi:hypothetical protein